MKKAIRLDRHTTLRWSCRYGEFLLWVRCTDLIAGTFGIKDFWECRDGDHILLTNRDCDLAVSREDVETGGPNVWPLIPGDRVAWVGWNRERGCNPAEEPFFVRVAECFAETIVYGDSTESRVIDGLFPVWKPIDR